MDLKSAYNKIDNLCCSNYHIHQKEFFKAYEETQDEDFCKDSYEMVDALEAIKEVVYLQEKLGCPLNAFFKAFDGIYIIDDWHDLYFAKPVFINGKFKIEQHYGVYDVATYYLDIKDYKKTWWLKEDQSE